MGQRNRESELAKQKIAQLRPETVSDLLTLGFFSKPVDCIAALNRCPDNAQSNTRQIDLTTTEQHQPLKPKPKALKIPSKPKRPNVPPLKKLKQKMSVAFTSNMAQIRVRRWLKSNTSLDFSDINLPALQRAIRTNPWLQQLLLKSPNFGLLPIEMQAAIKLEKEQGTSMSESHQPQLLQS
jgi:hypothetical protein